MKHKIFATAATLVGVLALASPLNAGHLWGDVECELSLAYGSSGPCCAAFAGGAGTATEYVWVNNNSIGWFSADITESNFTDYHCNVLVNGTPEFTVTVTGFPNNSSHGFAVGSCGRVGLD